MVTGLVAGVVGAILLISVVGGSGDEIEGSLPSTSHTPTTEVPGNTVPVAPDYPAGYEELAAGVAARPSELIIGEETITVALTTAVKRNTDPQAANWPLGGVWHLETPTGTVVESERIILGRFSPGAFAIEFPSAPFAGDTSFVRATMVERWDHTDISGSVDLPFRGEPFLASDSVTVRLTDDVMLTIPVLELGRFLGSVEWVLRGTGDTGGRVLVEATLLDTLGNAIGSYVSFPVLLDPSESGTIDLRWREPFPTSQEGAVSVVLNYRVALVEIVATDISVDLAAVPIGR
ncbi:MAG: hypothetical protein U9N84_12025 [Actinomycetota bacterium]|nr:hypothetical protein [Actinomycetota bacterium]